MPETGDKPEVLFVGSGPDWYVARFAQDFRLHHLPDGSAARLDPALAARIEALIAAGPVDAALIAALPRLRLIANTGTGYEKIDLDAAQARGVAVTNSPALAAPCVADMAFALLLAVARHVVRGDRYLRAGRWPAADYPLVPRLHGRRMGILGLGDIGMAIARRAAGFDMPVAYHNRRRRADVDFPYFASLRDLAAESDILMVACPGGVETRHLVDEAVLQALGPRGLLVNVSRGSVVDEAALIRALRDGTIAGAGLDVFENEPLVPAELMEMENAVLMPHRGGGTTETWTEVCDLVKANVRAFFRGEKLLSRVV